VGVDSKTKIIHTAVATAANVSDVAILPDLLHGEETRVLTYRDFVRETSEPENRIMSAKGSSSPVFCLPSWGECRAIIGFNALEIKAV